MHALIFGSVLVSAVVAVSLMWCGVVVRAVAFLADLKSDHFLVLLSLRPLMDRAGGYSFGHYHLTFWLNDGKEGALAWWVRSLREVVVRVLVWLLGRNWYI